MFNTLFRTPLEKSRLAIIFLTLSLTAILLYLIPITIHTADIATAAYRALYAERCRALLETVVCALSLTISFSLILLYENTKGQGMGKM